MAQIKIKELRELNSSELTKKVDKLRQESLNLRMQNSTSQLDNTARLKTVRREIARILTILNEQNA